VVDGEGRLAGAVSPQDAAMAPLSESVGRLATPRSSVMAVATRAEVAEYLEGKGETSLPVVDVNDRLVGVIRPATLLSMAQEEAGADIQMMVGASRDERAFSKVAFAVRKRLPWLHINLATAFLAAAVVGLFEETIAQFTALAVLLPVVAGQSGNTGAQALAVTMRGLTLREVRPRHWLRIAFKEGRVAFINGCAVALTTAAGVFLWSQSPGLALVIGTSMVISMLSAGLAGALIPIVLTVSGQDPAQASSIILTTVTDVIGFFSFLGLASLLASTL
jgi:magnesium transporter